MWAILIRYAPALENDAGAYIAAVATRCDLGADEQVRDIRNARVLGGLIHAIIWCVNT